MTFSEAFYGTYKLDKKDGKPHLKERIFAPVDGFWRDVYKRQASLDTALYCFRIYSFSRLSLQDRHRCDASTAHYNVGLFNNYACFSI